MKLEVDKVFLALTYDGHPLLCQVEEIKNKVAYCLVINGAWAIGFDIDTLEMCNEGTHQYVQPLIDKGYGAKVVMTNLPRGQMADYNERIAAALKILNGDFS